MGSKAERLSALGLGLRTSFLLPCLPTSSPFCPVSHFSYSYVFLLPFLHYGIAISACTSSYPLHMVLFEPLWMDTGVVCIKTCTPGVSSYLSFTRMLFELFKLIRGWEIFDFLLVSMASFCYLLHPISRGP